MKITVLGHSAYPEQGATCFYEIPHALQSFGHQVEVLALRRDGEPLFEEVGKVVVRRVAPAAR